MPRSRLKDEALAPNAAQESPGAELSEAAMDGAMTFAPRDGRSPACVGAAPVGDERDTLLRLIEAEFDGTPAYIATFLESRAPTSRPTRSSSTSRRSTTAASSRFSPYDLTPLGPREGSSAHS